MRVRVATVVTPDEPCYLLQEKIEQAPGNRGWRRVQILTVVRGDKLVDTATTLGPAEWYQAPEFQVLGGWGKYIEHTVGECREMADMQRDPTYWHQPHLEPTDLITGYHDQQDKKRRRRRALSQFGAKHKVQRSN